MIHFEWPMVFFLLPLPGLCRIFFKPTDCEKQAALRVPFFDEFAQSGRRNVIFGGSRSGVAIAILIWVLLVVAGARPQWMGEPIQQSASGRDLLMAVDLSGSMRERDFVIGDQAIDRLSATKKVATDFLNRRIGDRVGLILFGDQAYLQAPLTFDRATVATFLGEAAIGLAGDGTAIGDAIGLAVKRLRERRADQRVLILLTDGANTAGLISPTKAAELAADFGLTIYTIGIGADEMIVRDFFGARRVNPSVDLDEKTLVRIAEITGGRYFRARDSAELERIYELMDLLEPAEKDSRFFRPRVALFYWPLGFALLLNIMYAAYRLNVISRLSQILRPLRSNFD